MPRAWHTTDLSVTVMVDGEARYAYPMGETDLQSFPFSPGEPYDSAEVELINMATKLSSPVEVTHAPATVEVDEEEIAVEMVTVDGEAHGFAEGQIWRVDVTFVTEARRWTRTLIIPVVA